MSEAVPKGSAVYIRYLDHILNHTIPDAAERETSGWLTAEVNDSIYIEHDRTIESLKCSSGSGKGIILQKNCILEIRVICEKGERVEAASTVHRCMS